jgi:hypothetical protein
VKTDWHGHTRDHTLSGEQSILWDLVGAIVESQLPSEGGDAFVRMVGLSGPLPVRNYCVVYVIFRAGVCSLLEGLLPSSDPERIRLAAARRHYGQVARRWLEHPQNQAKF